MASAWTPARLKAFIISVLRSGTRRYPPKYETLNEAKTEKKINSKTGRVAQHYLCAGCGYDYPSTGVQVDHIQPVVDPKQGFTSWDNYIQRLFCPKENLQVLCKACHDIKTKEEKNLAVDERKTQLISVKQSKTKTAQSTLKAPSRKKKPTL